jgi:hypothetical protein
MSALLQQLTEQGITAEDIEKAASVHLFQKVAADNDIDLSELSPEDQEALYDQFETDVLPGILGEADEPKTASVEEIQEKLASLGEDDVIFLFEKQAAAEGFTAEDLEEAEDEKLAAAFQHFVNEILPEMAANDWEPVVKEASDEYYSEKEAAVEEAAAKLAEADLLGRHMAHSFHDELNKIGGAGSTVADHARDVVGAIRGARKAPRMAAESLVKNPLVQVGGAGAVAPGTGGAGYLAGRRAGKKKAEKKASAFDTLVIEKAAEILEANGIDPQTGETKQASIEDVVNARAVELLEASGYTFED